MVLEAPNPSIPATGVSGLSSDKYSREAMTVWLVTFKLMSLKNTNEPYQSQEISQEHVEKRILSSVKTSALGF